MNQKRVVMPYAETMADTFAIDTILGGGVVKQSETNSKRRIANDEAFARFLARWKR